MGGSSQSWGIEIDKEWAKAEGEIRDVVIWLGIEALDRVKRKTPVDTGHARNNWIVSIGAPDIKDTMNAPPKKPKAGEPKAPMAMDTFAASNMSMLSGYPNDGSYPVIYLQNNLPYALALEYGHSKQAPLGMVEITKIELEALMQGIEIGSTEEWVNS